MNASTVVRLARRCLLEAGLSGYFGQVLSGNLVNVILEFCAWPVQAIHHRDGWGKIDLVEDRMLYQKWYLWYPGSFPFAKFIGFGSPIEICQFLLSVRFDGGCSNADLLHLVEFSRQTTQPVHELLTQLEFGYGPNRLSLVTLRSDAYPDMFTLFHPDTDTDVCGPTNP
jgi:hypothetical protein